MYGERERTFAMRSSGNQNEFEQLDMHQWIINALKIPTDVRSRDLGGRPAAPQQPGRDRSPDDRAYPLIA